MSKKHPHLCCNGIGRHKPWCKQPDKTVRIKHLLDISEREQIEASRLHRPLAAVTAAVNAQLQTPESWRAVWADVTAERRR